MERIALLNTVRNSYTGVPSRASLAALPLSQRAAAWGTALGSRPKHSSSSSSNATSSSSTNSESCSSDTAAAQQQSSTTNNTDGSSSTVTVATAGGLLTAGAPCCKRTEACVTEVSNCYVAADDQTANLLCFDTTGINTANALAVVARGTWNGALLRLDSLV
jgi:hypothetical protein